MSDEQGYPAGCAKCRDLEMQVRVYKREAVEHWERSKAQAAIIAGLRHAISSALCLVAEGPEVMRSVALRDEVEKVLLSTLKMGDAAALERSK